MKACKVYFANKMRVCTRFGNISIFFSLCILCVDICFTNYTDCYSVLITVCGLIYSIDGIKKVEFELLRNGWRYRVTVCHLLYIEYSA